MKNRMIAPFFMALGLATLGLSQTQRLADFQVKNLMEGIEEDVDRFNDAISPEFRKATIRSATSEVSIESYTKDLKESAKVMRERFKSDYSSDSEVLAFLKQAHGIERRASQGSNLFGAEKEWPRLSGSIGSLAKTYGVDWKASPDTWTARRMNDKDLEGVVGSLVASGESFKKGLDSALKNAAGISSDDRKAGLESADRFVESAKDLREVVKDRKDPAGALSLLNASAKDLQSLVGKHGLTSAVASRWAPVETWLTTIASAFPVAR